MIINLRKPTLFRLTDPDVGGQDLILKPGLNSVSAAQWKKHANHPQVKHHINSGALIVEDEPSEMVGDASTLDLSTPEATLAADVASLKSQKPAAAVVYAEQVLDINLAKAWLAAENRAPVKNALKAQIAKLEEELELRDRSQSRQITTGNEPEKVELVVSPNASDD